MPGAGKALASSVALELCVPVFICGDVVREEAARRMLEPTPENIGRLMFDLRREGGLAVVAERLIPKIMAQESEYAVVEGGRSLEEIAELKKHFSVRTMAIRADPAIRFKRLVWRRRSDDPVDLRAFTSREEKEIEVGLGAAVAAADEVIVNEGSVEQFKGKVREALVRWMKTA